MKISGKDIPQANRFELVIAAVEAVNNGAKTDIEISDYISKLRGKASDDPGRDGRYYRRSGQQLGLISNRQNTAELTERGQLFITASVNEKERILIESLFDLKLFRALLPFLEQHPDGVSAEAITRFLLSITDLAETTVRRRLSTIIRWLKSVNVAHESDGLIKLKNDIPTKVPLIDFQDTDEPLLPKSIELKEYQLIESRNQAASEEITFRIDAAKRERANKAHNYLTNSVAGRIRQTGNLPRSNRYVDLAARIQDHSYIFEMKSLNEDNAHSQIRVGLSQLYEYRYLQNLPDAILVLVIEKPLPNRVAWMHQYLEEDRQIRLVWDGDNQLYASPQTQHELAFLW